ncbi:unnamed protein product [Penicillium olsonii]|uniref:non-specific serine/threonine protein kinase n=1 Tax=Penicillium olsonii TaxID=99116 RepID=A0A9W4MR12_PENOL|nr:unnamed protein product [Penicillium olsonii]CAG8077524.1 unnamed protein product [Penicillium olsonii]CAG8177873.1 unnamed protein product [Penicillium olsonii]
MTTAKDPNRRASPCSSPHAESPQQSVTTAEESNRPACPPRCPSPHVESTQEDLTTVGDSNQPAPPSPSPHDEDSQKDIEEGRAAYQPGGFHPVYIGDVFNNRYKILNKLGYGRYSTVWLVQDVQNQGHETREFLALKVLSAECYGDEKDIFEREILKHLRDCNPEQLGYKQICHLVDDFEHKGPNGTHICLVFEAMGETLDSFQAMFPECRIPNLLTRRFAIQMLLALDYAHDHNVIHTDIKQTNIFVKIQNHTLIKTGYLAKESPPQQDKDEEQYAVIPSRPLRQYYFNDDARLSDFNIVLGDWGVSSWADNHLTENIQPVALRAPEVLIRAPWNATTDLWNLGAILLELMCAMRMFSGAVPPDRHYEVKEHLREIVDLFGPFPKALLEKGAPDIVSIFDDEGRPKDEPPMDRPGLSTEAFTPGLDQEVREQFVSFLFALMKLNPAERLSPEDLLRHPWLDAIR